MTTKLELLERVRESLVIQLEIVDKEIAATKLAEQKEMLKNEKKNKKD